MPDATPAPSPTADRAKADQAAFNEALAALNSDPGETSETSDPEAVDVDLAELVDEADAPKPKPDDKAEPKPDEKKPDDKPKEEKKESLGESWKKVRAEKKALNFRQADLDKREADLKAKEAAFTGQGKELETLKAKAALIDKLVEGDAEALEQLGLDMDKLTAGFLKRQSGDSVTARLEKQLRELQDKLKAKEDDEAKAADDAAFQARAQEASTRFLTAVKDEPILKKFNDRQRVAMGDAVAAEYLHAKKPVPTPEEIAKEVVTRLREELRIAREGEEEAAAQATPAAKPAAAAPPRTLSRGDAKERAPQPKSKTPSRDEEEAEIAAMLRGSAA